jgi:hypothetical protein
MASWRWSEAVTGKGLAFFFLRSSLAAAGATTLLQLPLQIHRRRLELGQKDVPLVNPVDLMRR